VRIRIPALRWGRSQIDLQSSLNQTAGIKSVRINRAAQCVTIRYVPEVEATLQKILHKLENCHNQESIRDFHNPAQEQKSIISINGEWSGLKLPLLAVGLTFLSQVTFQPGLRLLAALSLLRAIFPVSQRAIYSLTVEGRFNIDCMDLLALTLSAWQGKLMTPALVLTLHELGDAIREKTARITAVQAANLKDAIGYFAWIKEAQDLPPYQVPSDQVQVGQTVVVYPGEQIPVDGKVLQGDAIIDQQSLTGESLPIAGRVGTQVYASTLVRSGQLYIQAERVGRNTRAAAGLELLRQAPVYDTRMANYAEKVADRLILPSLFLAAVVLFTTHDPARTAAILTLDFVTGIRVSIPMAFLGALNHTARHGVLIRSGRTLEGLAEVDTVIFDKTGTLTQGRVAIAEILGNSKSLDSTRILQLAASAEQRLNHPLADALVQCSEERGVPLLPRENWSYEVGLGVRAKIQGHEVRVGSERYIRQSGIDVDIRDQAQLQTLIFVACDQEFLGTIRYTDPVRNESLELIQRLQKEYGITIYLLTGDNLQQATQVAEELGIPSQQVYAEAFPEQKAAIVRDLHKQGHTVAFVGDGLNDSVALAYADVSISFAKGAEVARETADVVLMENNLLDFLEVIAIARQTRALIEQNIALVVLPNLLALGLATTRGLSPLIATVVHNGSAIAAAFNSLRPVFQHQLNPDRTAS
jgi:Cu2+-exporting ATPase